MIQRLKILGNLMSYKPVRSRRFLLPAAVVAAMAVAFTTLPAAVADQTGAVEAQLSPTTSATPSASATEIPAAATTESTPSVSAASAEKGTTAAPSAIVSNSSATVPSSSPAPPTKSAAQSPSALPTAPATLTDRIVELQSTGLNATVAVSAQIGVPDRNPESNEAKLTVRKGGDRQADGSVKGLPNVTFNFHRTDSESKVTGGTPMGLSCTTDANGRCGIFVPLTKGSNYFYATESEVPAGWSDGRYWGSETEFIRYNSGEITSGGRTSSRIKELPGSARSWPNVRDNPKAPQKCGINMAVVYDLSGSVTDPSNDTKPTMLSKYKAAGKQFVDALTGTPSKISLHTFASSAPAQNSEGSTSNNATMPLTPVAQKADAEKLKSKIDGFGKSKDSNGRGTNWDRGLAQVGTNYDVVLFLTDGDPTFYGVGDKTGGSAGGSGNSTSLREVEEAIHSANKLKASNAKVIAVGIGSGIDSAAGKQRLELISGTNDFFTSGFDTLGKELTNLATKDCNGTVTVVKSIQDAAGNVTAGANWEFGTTTDGVAIESGSKSGFANNDGALNFKVNYPAGANSKTVTIAEKQQDGFELVKQSGVNAVCTNLATQKTVAVSSSGALGFTVDVPQADPITCSVINKKLTSKISIVKTAADYNGGQPVTGPDNAPNVPSGTSVTWTYTVTNTGTTTLKNIVVQDDPVGTATCKKTTLAPAESTTCTATGIVKAQ